MISFPTAHHNTWFISDTHFSHKKLLTPYYARQDKRKSRDFDTVEEHDDHIITNINAVVRPSDYLFHYGDFAFNEKAPEMLDRINCKNIVLCLGNHDRENNFKHKKIQGIYDYQVFQLADYKIVSFHYPIQSWYRMLRDEYIHCHGHTHVKELITGFKRIHVGVDATNYQPIELATVVELAEQSKLTFGI